MSVFGCFQAREFSGQQLHHSFVAFQMRSIHAPRSDDYSGVFCQFHQPSVIFHLRLEQRALSSHLARLSDTRTDSPCRVRHSPTVLRSPRIGGWSGHLPPRRQLMDSAPRTSHSFGSSCPTRATGSSDILGMARGLFHVSFLSCYTIDQWPNKSPEPTAVGAVRSAVAVHAASRRWLSFFRYA